MNTQPAAFVPSHGAAAPLAWVREHLSDGLRAWLERRIKRDGVPAEGITVVSRRSHFYAEVRWGSGAYMLPLAGQRPLGFSQGAGA